MLIEEVLELTVAKKASDFAPDFRIAANFFRPCKGS